MARVARRGRAQQTPPLPPIPASSLVGQPGSIYVRRPTSNIFILNTVNPHLRNVSDVDLYAICYRPIRSASTSYNYHLPNQEDQHVAIYHYSNYYGERVDYEGTFFFVGIEMNNIRTPASCDRSRRYQWYTDDVARTVLPEGGANLGFLIFAEGRHSGGRDDTSQYRILLSDIARFPDFQVGRDVTL